MQILKGEVEQLCRSYSYKNLTGPGICGHNVHIQISMKTNARIVSQLVDPLVRAVEVQTLDSSYYLQRWGRKKWSVNI